MCLTVNAFASDSPEKPSTAVERSTLVWRQEVRRRAVLLKPHSYSPSPLMLSSVCVLLSVQQQLYSKIAELRHHVLVTLQLEPSRPMVSVCL